VNGGTGAGAGRWRPSAGWPTDDLADISPAATVRSDGPTPQNRLAAATRRLIAVLVGRDVPGEDLDEGVSAVDAAVDRLEAAATGKRPRRLPRAEDHPQDYFPTSPVIGWANPLAPPVVLEVVETDDGRELRGTVTFDYPYEGPPTCVHGGVIAQVCDELLGALMLMTGHAGMTGTLTTRYRRPTPLLVDLVLHARVVGVDGRKATAWCGIYHGDVLTAEAEGVFIKMRPERMIGIAAEHAPGASGEVLDERLAAAVAELDDPGAAD